MAGQATETNTSPNSRLGRRPTSSFGRWIDALAMLAVTQRRKRQPWRGMLFATPTGLDVYLPGKGNAAPRRIGELRADGSEHFASRSDRRHLARMKRDPDRTVLRLSRDEIIEKTITVPTEARDVIAPIVQNQIEMISPWPVDRAIFDWDVADRASGPHVAVQVVVAGKASIRRHLDLAEKHGIAPKIIDYGDDAAASTEINLFQHRGAQPVRGRGVIQGVLLLLAVGAITSGTIGVLNGLADREALSWVEDRQAMAEQRAIAARKTTSQAASLEARYRLPSDEKVRRQPKVIILEALTRALPDGTWLQRLEINNDNLRIVGQSRDAAALIALLEASPFFSAVRLAAPVTPVPGGQQFVIEGRCAENLDALALLKTPITNEKPTTGGLQPLKRRGSEQ